jgi:hypothetical protein
VVNFKSKKKKKRITFLVRLQLPTVEISWDNPHEWLTTLPESLRTICIDPSQLLLVNNRERELINLGLVGAASLFVLSIEPQFKKLVAVRFHILSTHLVVVQIMRIISTISTSFPKWQSVAQRTLSPRWLRGIHRCRKHLHTCREVATLRSPPRLASPGGSVRV